VQQPENWSENLRLESVALSRDIGQHCRPYEKAPLVAGDLDSPTINQHPRPFRLALTDQSLDPGSAGGTNHWPHLHTLLQAVANDPLRCRFGDRLDKTVAGLAHRDCQRGRQAALASAAERAVGNYPGSGFQVGIRQDDDRILGAALDLGSLAGGRGAGVHRLGHRGRSDETDCLNTGVVKDGFGGLARSVDQVHHPPGEIDLLHQLEYSDHRKRNSLGGFDDEGIAAGQGIGH
jgi:hypothetical protein